LPYRRSGVREFVLDLPAEQYDTEGYQRMPVGYPYPFLFDIVDETGAKLDYAVVDVQDVSMGMENESGGAQKLKVRRHRILMDVELPSMGYRSFGIAKREPRYVAAPQPAGERGHIAQSGGVLENEFLKVKINSNGTFDLTDKESGIIREGMHYFEDRVSTGDWPHLDPAAIKDSVVTSLGLNAVVTMDEANPQRGIYRIEMSLPVPKEATGAWYRSSDTVDIPITVVLTLSKGSHRLDVRTKIDNRAKDHRLFVMLPTKVQTDTVSVETPFAVEERNFIPRDVGDNSEADYRYQPMQNFIDMSDGTNGLAVINKGMREYAVCDDPDRTVSLTLLRTYRAYLNANTDMTPEEFARYPETHCPGELEFEYAICPHVGDWQEGGVMAETYDFKAPIRAIQGPAKKGELPAMQSFFTVEPEGKLMLSALCQGHDGEGAVLRLWNTADEAVEAKITTTLPFMLAAKVNMEESETLEKLELSDGVVAVSMRKAEIATIRFCR
ncbi:MAG: glycoside hydrolase family 38 C-terminal domain-containing protein, partial [Verrucomicrobiota bacterium]